MDTKSSNIQESALGFFQKAKNAVIDWVNKLDLNSKKVIEILTFFAIGFSSGFLLKKYFKYVFISVLVVLLAVFLLENSGFIHVDWSKIRGFIGISSADTVDSVFNVIINWIKSNILLTISGALGFIIGYKVG
ncbi:hypothetical protein A3F66_02215 [candidate division TM6 bacterium RIFCSPHIGHO2_12_FULL_32_22]|nr:MAG: hypothetical protein A3F66_02215 [candidate division TM6 bacterium RIFCSPHIGHO2_12_FULL_32_22]